MVDIKTYPEMDEKIVSLLRINDENPVHAYAAQLIDQLQAENARLREAITDFAKADKGLRIDYSKYCDKNGYPPDWVWDQVDISHDMWDKAVAKLNEIAEEILREGNDEGE